MWEPDYPEDYWYDTKPTSEYQHGTLTIYRSPKRPKANKPAYGYKFVEETMPKKRKKRRY